MHYVHVDTDESLRSTARAAIRTHSNYLLGVIREVSNPYGYARQAISASAAGFFIPHEDKSGYWWQGENARLASNPPLFRNSKPHWTTQVGGIANGITGRETDGSGIQSTSGTSCWDDWRWVEQWLPRAAWYMIATAALSRPGMEHAVKHLLAPENRSVLLQFAASNTLLAFDYDGTLAPIVANRDSAAMRVKTRRLLAHVSRLYPCAVISGRALADVADFLRGIALQHLVGNHGLEPHQRMGYFKRLASQIHEEIEAGLAQVPGVELEDKVYSLAIHYRRSRHRLWAREEVLRIISRVSVPVRTIAGKLVINVLPKDAPHKGIALQTLRVRQSADTAIYVGDDDTDEDVFRSERPNKLLGVRVARASNSAAQFYVRNQSEVDDLLQFLANARRHVHILDHGS